MTSAEHEAIALEMSLDEGEFRRLINRLPAAGEAISECSSRRWRLLPANVDICVHPLCARRMGALVLPRLRVELDLSPLPDNAAREEFLRRFRRNFQRGGG